MAEPERLLSKDLKPGTVLRAGPGRVITLDKRAINCWIVEVPSLMGTTVNWDWISDDALDAPDSPWTILGVPPSTVPVGAEPEGHVYGGVTFPSTPSEPAYSAPITRPEAVRTGSISGKMVDPYDSAAPPIGEGDLLDVLRPLFTEASEETLIGLLIRRLDAAEAICEAAATWSNIKLSGPGFDQWQPAVDALANAVTAWRALKGESV